MTIQVVMPIGGVGSRFSKAGISTPKPLIDVAGKPMFLRAIESVQRIHDDLKFIFVIREDQNESHQLGDRIKREVPESEILVLKGDTGGASSTVIAARALINTEEPLLVLDCDIAFESLDYREKVTSAMSGQADGVLLSFKSQDPRYSFARINEDGLVIETAEKVAISDHALMGAYFYSSASSFISAAESLHSRALSALIPEYFMSLTFNFLLEEGKKVTLAKGDFYCFGTPEELNDYIRTRLPISA